MSLLSFDAETHEYTVGGVIVPSVTQLMQKYGIVNAEYYGLFGCVRGSHVHTACQYDDEGCLDIKALDPQIEPYIRAYKDFKKQTNIKIDRIETPLFDRDNWFAGTFDRTAKIGNNYILIDIKTGVLPRWINVQLAGYRMLILKSDIPKPNQYYALQLRNDGTYRFTYVSIKDITEGDKIFKSMLNIENYNRKANK